jgi:uncharacterized protein YdeI (YjbR/CyaY-like superfamily)
VVVAFYDGVNVLDRRNRVDQDELLLPDVAAWKAWLEANDETSDGVWLVQAKKGVTEPTSLTYEEALQEALCSGWIDGQKRGRDGNTSLQRYTPRRKRSIWSQKNVERIAMLTEAGRMRPRGIAEVERAKADGRWDAAYAGSATIQVPDDLQAALDANPEAAATFGLLTSTNRYSILHPVVTAAKPETRARRIERFITMLANRETPHPQKLPAFADPATNPLEGEDERA